MSEQNGVYSYNPSTNEILFRLNPVCKCNREVVQVLNEQQATITNLQERVYELEHMDNLIPIQSYKELDERFDGLVDRVDELIKEKWEQQATISQLKEENKQLKLTLSEYGVNLKAFEVFKQKIGYYDKVIDDE